MQFQFVDLNQKGHDVRFGSKADTAVPPTNVRVAPKADIALNVRYVPNCDID